VASRSCSAGFHDDCAAICICWCHKIERVRKPVSKTYRVELHTLTATRAEFREVQERAERGSGIIWGLPTVTLNTTTYDTPTHTWAMPRTEWEELGKPLSFDLRVELK
jgi:hypothetical protein